MILDLTRDDLEGIFSAAFDTMNDAAIAVDPDGMVIAGNAAFEIMFGFSGTKPNRLPFHRLCIDDVSMEGEAGTSPRWLLLPPSRQRYRRRDGTCFWGERSVAPVQGRDGSYRGYFLIIRDLTGQRLNETNLKALLSLPTMSSDETQPCMTTILDLGFRHFGVEHGCLGRLEKQDLVVETVGGSLPLHQGGERLPLVETFGALQRDRDGLLIIEHVADSPYNDHAYYRQNRLEFYVACEIRIAGQLYGLLSFGDRASRPTTMSEHDLTLLRVMAHWAGMLLEGRSTRAALAQATHDLERFAYIASHDLQEPLRRVVTYCQILMEDFGTEFPDEVAEVVEIIQAGGWQMRRMVNDLLDYSRLNKQLQQPFEPVDMASIFHHAIEDLAAKRSIDHAQINVAHLPLVWGRGPLLQTLCYHLLSNALKFAGDQRPKIEIDVEDHERYWQFSVADQGIGIEPRFAERIFDIFQRLHSRDDFSGSGSGLAICKLIVERHGGAIWLDTDYRGGARFLFTLPKDRSTLQGIYALHP